MGDRKDRDERLAAALRENLRRRKAQQRERGDAGTVEPAPPPPPDRAEDGTDG